MQVHVNFQVKCKSSILRNANASEIYDYFVAMSQCMWYIRVDESFNVERFIVSWCANESRYGRCW